MFKQVFVLALATLGVSSLTPAASAASLLDGIDFSPSDFSPSASSIEPAAESTGFNFSYTYENGDILSGMMTGEIQEDGDTVIISAVTMPMFNGSPAPDIGFVESFVESNTGIEGSPTVSFSGSTMDIIACNNKTPCNDGFAFDGTGFVEGFPTFQGNVSFGDVLEEYNPANWSLSAKSTPTTPEPNTLIALGFIGSGLFLNKRLSRD